MNQSGRSDCVEISCLGYLLRLGADCDRKLTEVLQCFGRPPLGWLMRCAGAPGAPRIFIPAAALFTLFIGAQQRYRAALAMVACALLTLGCIHLSKAGIYRARPRATNQIDRSTSFPSGHAIAGVSVYGAAAIAIGQIYPDIKEPILFMFVIGALLIGLSRACLGFHWLSDVLAGFAVGALILVLCTALGV